jgi:hypothetical protein
MANVSITARGFEESLEAVMRFLGVAVLSGERGKPYRGRSQTSVKKSFVFNEKTSVQAEELDKAILDLIEEWNGIDNIAAAVAQFSIESIHYEINFSANEMSERSGVALDSQIVRMISETNASLGVSWNSR